MDTRRAAKRGHADSHSPHQISSAKKPKLNSSSSAFGRTTSLETPKRYCGIYNSEDIAGNRFSPREPSALPASSIIKLGSSINNKPLRHEMRRPEHPRYDYADYGPSSDSNDHFSSCGSISSSSEDDSETPEARMAEVDEELDYRGIEKSSFETNSSDETDDSEEEWEPTPHLPDTSRHSFSRFKDKKSVSFAERKRRYTPSCTPKEPRRIHSICCEMANTLVRKGLHGPNATAFITKTFNNKNSYRGWLKEAYAIREQSRDFNSKADRWMKSEASNRRHRRLLLNKKTAGNIIWYIRQAYEPQAHLPADGSIEKAVGYLSTALCSLPGVIKRIVTGSDKAIQRSFSKAKQNKESYTRSSRRRDEILNEPGFKKLIKRKK